MKRLYILLAAVLLSASVISAQNFRTGYFLDGYMYKYQLNPAFQGERGFVALPALGGLGVGVESNMSLGTFYYPSDGKLNTGTKDLRHRFILQQKSLTFPVGFSLFFCCRILQHTICWKIRRPGRKILNTGRIRVFSKCSFRTATQRKHIKKHLKSNTVINITVIKVLFSSFVITNSATIIGTINAPSVNRTYESLPNGTPPVRTSVPNARISINAMYERINIYVSINGGYLLLAKVASFSVTDVCLNFSN